MKHKIKSTNFILSTIGQADIAPNIPTALSGAVTCNFSMSDLNQYSRKFFDSLKVNELPVYLKKLENILKKRFEDEDDFNLAIKHIIEDLKALGHNIYSLEYDSDIKRGREIWGSEYHDRQPNGLEIEFISPAEVHVQWTTASEIS